MSALMAELNSILQSIMYIRLQMGKANQTKLLEQTLGEAFSAVLDFDELDLHVIGKDYSTMWVHFGASYATIVNKRVRLIKLSNQ